MGTIKKYPQKKFVSREDQQRLDRIAAVAARLAQLEAEYSEVDLMFRALIWEASENTTMKCDDMVEAAGRSREAIRNIIRRERNGERSDPAEARKMLAARGVLNTVDRVSEYAAKA